MKPSQPLETILPGLQTTATNRERILAIGAIGLSDSEIADVMYSSPATIGNWRRGNGEPRTDSSERLDYLRNVMKIIIEDAGMEPERAAMWFESRSPNFGYERPSEIFKRGPSELLNRLLKAVEAST